jgi:signal transduction histidine kinase
MIRRISRSARTRILAWVLVPVVVVLGLTFATSLAILTSDKQAQIDGHLLREATELSNLARDGVDPATGRQFQSATGLLNTFISRTATDPNETMFIIIDGEAVAKTSDTPAVRLDRDQDFLDLLRDEQVTVLGDYQTQVGSVRYIVVPVTTETDSGALVGIIFQDIELEALRQLLLRLALIVFLALISAAGIGWIVAGRVLKPISQIRDAAHKINESDLSLAIRVEGSGTEIEELANEFNAMIDRLKNSFEIQRQFIDDAGHEMRTPLTIISGHFDLISADPSQRDSSMLIIKQELDRMSRMVKDLQNLTKSNQPGFINAQVISLSELADALLVKGSALGDRNFILTGTFDGVNWKLDEQRITQAVLQLLSNAVSHTSEAGKIELNVTVSNDQLEISVEDDGPGIPESERFGVVKRFARGAGSAQNVNGSGLGLALVSAIAEGHRGELKIADSHLGGAKVTLSLPQ